MDSAKTWSEIAGSKTALETLFGRDVISFVYPYGDMDTRVRRFTRRAGYKLGRAVRPGDPNLWADPYRLPTFELRRETRLSEAKRYVSRHRTTILLLHQIVPSPAAFTQWSRADFSELVAWLDRTKVRVTTLAGLYREYWVKRLERFMDEVAQAYPDRRKQLLFENVDVDATGTSNPR